MEDADDEAPRGLRADDAVSAASNLNHSLDDRLHLYDPYPSATVNTLHCAQREGALAYTLAAPIFVAKVPRRCFPVFDSRLSHARAR